MGSTFKYSEEQLKFLRAEYPLYSIDKLTTLFNDAFSTNKTKSQLRACLKNHGIKSGRTGHFVKGDMPWNNGKKGIQVHENSKATQFKKGNKPSNLKPIGHERICNKDGYVLIKVAEENPHTGASTRYRFKHIVIWEKENGPVPKGKVVIFVDGDKTNINMENLSLVDRKLLLQLNRNKYGLQPDELKPTLLNLSKLQVKIFDKSRKVADAE